jgi:hypothetical protein
MLRRLCTLGRVAGWALIVLGGLVVGGLAAQNSALVGGGVQFTISGGLAAVDDILTGLLVLATVQFIRYVLDEDTEPGWLLRNVHIVLSLFALYLLIYGGMQFGPFWWTFLNRHVANSPENTMGWTVLVVVSTVTMFLPLVTKVLCFLGMAAILRTVLPVMAESKTLA